jgi:glycosyltransferase involved in cell wall biosynthesis
MTFHAVKIGRLLNFVRRLSEMVYRVSIGILAHNEAGGIGATLASLRRQSIFRPADCALDCQIEVVVVPNGCTDQTAVVAESMFQSAIWTGAAVESTTLRGNRRRVNVALENGRDRQRQSRDRNVSLKVCELAAAGKSNAWNRYVHELADAATEFCFLMDADIQLDQPRTLERMLGNLIATPEAWVAIDRPIKDVQLRQAGNVMESISAGISDDDGSGKGITGQLYCARAEKLRQIWMPQGLAVEDGFLRAMILTDRFTGPEQFERIVYTPDATHIYEAYTGVLSLLRHEKRIVIGTIVNQLIFDYLWATCSANLDAGTVVQQNNEQDPKWVLQLVARARRQRRWWLLHPSHTFRRLRNLRRYSGLNLLKRLPIELAATLADWFVFVQANWAVQRGQGLGYW